MFVDGHGYWSIMVHGWWQYWLMDNSGTFQRKVTLKFLVMSHGASAALLAEAAASAGESGSHFNRPQLLFAKGTGFAWFINQPIDQSLIKQSCSQPAFGWPISHPISTTH